MRQLTEQKELFYWVCTGKQKALQKTVIKKLQKCKLFTAIGSAEECPKTRSEKLFTENLVTLETENSQKLLWEKFSQHQLQFKWLWDLLSRSDKCQLGRWLLHCDATCVVIWGDTERSASDADTAVDTRLYHRTMGLTSAHWDGDWGYLEDWRGLRDWG